MQVIDGRLVHSASDLNDYLQCKRLTELEALVARGEETAPAVDDPRGDLIRKKGIEHEERHLERLRETHGGAGVVAFERAQNTFEALYDAELRTREAMARGVPILYQATFFDGAFVGHADFLRRVERPSNLGAWSYEVLDTKLALESKPYFLVQLCNYGEHLERIQGVMPAHGSIVLGDGSEERYRLHDYLAYYRHLKARYLEFVTDPARANEDDAATYPHRCTHCAICRWDEACKAKRRADDHLSLVASMRRDQIAKLETAGITSTAALARADDLARPGPMSAETFAKLRRQARLQNRARTEGGMHYELIEHAPPMGFALLPAPAPGDVFFDMEGDPLYEPGRGLEYLFGCWLPDDEPHFRAFWGCDRAAEKAAFEAFVDFIVERRRHYPGLHVYHYAPYEKTALRRLAQAHCTRENQIDDLLRGEVFVDLFAVVRQALVVSEERYGLKNVEKFYEQLRATDVKKGDESIVMFEEWLEKRDDQILEDIGNYNKDDCESTFRLREWLLARRDEAIAAFGVDLPLRPVKAPNEPCHAEYTDGCSKCDKRRADEREEARRTDLERRLLRDVLPPQTEDEYRAMATLKRARYLLGNLLAYHRREEKPAYWQYFDRREDLDRLLTDREAIDGLQLREDVPPERIKRSFVYTFSFPDQPFKLESGDSPHDPATEPYKTTGTILEIDEERRELKLKCTNDLESARKIRALMPRHPYPSDAQREALGRIARAFEAHALEVGRRATYDLLTARDPRVRGVSPGEIVQPALVSAETVSGIVASLDDSYLFVQGPPGSGKTTKGAKVICDLLQRGKRVGITSTGHKAIHNLLEKIEIEMAERHATFRGLYKYNAGNAGSKYTSPLPSAFVQATDDNKAFDGFDYDLAAGTSWLFAREELDGGFDYLFIDEAGQVSLADALAVSSSARNVVVLGDPSQLAHVGQGVHPLHVGDSVLQHLLGDAETVPKHRGVFLDVSYRMQPEICAYVSDASYEGRLKPQPAAELHAVFVAGARRAGLEYLPIEHDGNSSASPEEADATVAEILRLREGEVVDSWPPERSGIARPLENRDIIVVTPYNAQRRLIKRKLQQHGIDVEVGTVDKFQGREAAVVFYSMATSSGEQVPRDMEFLFERNRFNVAISRARALSVLVCSPRLLDIACRTPDQMALANLLCAFAERAGERVRATRAPTLSRQSHA
jgi:predicted RecB family nuclease